MYFLHILNHRHRGVRIPRAIPASLRATLNQGDIDYDVSRAQLGRGKEEDVPLRRSRDRDDWNSTTSSRKDDFAAGYLSRLGVGEGSSKYNSAGKFWLWKGWIPGTDFSSVKDTDWEKVRLQRELASLNEKIESTEAEARSRRLGRGNNPSSKSALIKRELDQMLDFKRRELRRLKDGEDIERGGNLDRVRNEIQSFKEQIDALADHLSRREEELRGLQRSIEAI
jgi:actin cytoskeleton-regulatory complex protein END3